MAAKKKTSKSKAVVSWKEKLAALAEQESDRKMTIGGGNNTITLSKGKFKFQGEDLGDSLSVVVVDFVKRRAWYDRPFDEDNPGPPACVAISEDGKNMEPHDVSPEPQADACADCWANEFESDARGKGKACREKYSLAVISADELGTEDPQMAFIGVPPTSLKAWDSYMLKRNKVLNLPAMAFVTTIYFDDEVDYQKLLFEEEGRVEDDAHFAQLFALRDEAHELLMEPPDTSQYEKPTAKKKAKKKAAKKTSKKKVTKKKASKKKATRKKSRFS